MAAIAVPSQALQLNKGVTAPARSLPAASKASRDRRHVPAPPLRVAAPENGAQTQTNAFEELKALASSKVAKQSVNRPQNVSSGVQT